MTLYLYKELLEENREQIWYTYDEGFFLATAF